MQKVIDYMRKKELSEETARTIAEEAREKNLLTRIVATPSGRCPSCVLVCPGIGERFLCITRSCSGERLLH